MTLALTIVGRHSLWALADRRLSLQGGRVLRDDAIKIMRLERGNDVGLLAYAGLGATPAGIEPSEWMNGVLRGRNAPFEASLHLLAQAISKQMPKHLLTLGPPEGLAHAVVIPAFIDDRPQMFVIRLHLAKHGDHEARVYRLIADKGPPRAVRVAVAGSGQQAVIADMPRVRSLLRLVAAHERHRNISPYVVADALARLNADIARTVKSVGPDCIVTWNYRRNGPIKFSPAHQSYSGMTRCKETPFIPTNSNGMDVSSLLKVASPYMLSHLREVMAGNKEAQPDEKAMNEAVRKLPTTPEDNLP